MSSTKYHIAGVSDIFIPDVVPGSIAMGAVGFTPDVGFTDLVLDPYVTLEPNDAATLNGFIFAVVCTSSGNAEAGRFGPSPFAALWKKTSVAAAPTQQFADSATVLTAGSDGIYTNISAVSSASGNGILYTITFPAACYGLTFNLNGAGVFVHTSLGGE